MANLKTDLRNKITNDRYFSEMELIRLAQEPNMNYKDKIDSMSYYLKELAIFNGELALLDHYFQDQPPVMEEPSPQAAQTLQQPVQQQVHQGQSHGE